MSKSCRGLIMDGYSTSQVRQQKKKLNKKTMYETPEGCVNSQASGIFIFKDLEGNTCKGALKDTVL